MTSEARAVFWKVQVNKRQDREDEKSNGHNGNQNQYNPVGQSIGAFARAGLVSCRSFKRALTAVHSEIPPEIRPARTSCHNTCGDGCSVFRIRERRSFKKDFKSASVLQVQHKNEPRAHLPGAHPSPGTWQHAPERSRYPRWAPVRTFVGGAGGPFVAQMCPTQYRAKVLY
jgi:hypothetical protein